MKTEVLVVGAGPVGLTMAIELARYKIGARIIDKAPERSDKSKALLIWSRSLEPRSPAIGTRSPHTLIAWLEGDVLILCWCAGSSVMWELARANRVHQDAGNDTRSKVALARGVLAAFIR